MTSNNKNLPSESNRFVTVNLKSETISNKSWENMPKVNVNYLSNEMFLPTDCYSGCLKGFSSTKNAERLFSWISKSLCTFIVHTTVHTGQ